MGINTTDTVELTDLELNSEVKGGHSSGGAAGGIVSEGQGYGLFIGSATAATQNKSGQVPTGTVTFIVDGSGVGSF